jgi:hypothetical protein
LSNEYVAPCTQNFPAIRADIEYRRATLFFSKQNSTKACFFSLKMSKERDVWSDKETFELLAAWGAVEIQKKTSRGSQKHGYLQES